MILLGIIALISFLLYNGYIERAKERTCENNREILASLYNAYLEYNNFEHTELLFKQCLDEYNVKIYPDDGE